MSLIIVLCFLNICFATNLYYYYCLIYDFTNLNLYIYKRENIHVTELFQIV